MNIQTLWRIAPVTLSLIFSCVIVAVIQIVAGVNIDAPTNADLLNFGANFLPLSLGGEPWRIVSAGFLHIGILHLLFNCFALFYFGQVAERIIGSIRFLSLFIICVMAGNVLTLATSWLDVLAGLAPSISAGASGGVMGIGGLLLILALLRAPIEVRLNTKNLFMVMALNLLMGFAIDGINNAGHIGGMLAGLLLGLGFRMQLSRTRTPIFNIIAALLLLIMIGLMAACQLPAH